MAVATAHPSYPRMLEAAESTRLAWLRRAVALIDGTVSDAEAHAVRAITGTLKATPEGRPTLRKAGRSPSAVAAANRLAELWEALAGPSRSSLAGLIRDARVAAYRVHLAHWWEILPPEVRRPPPFDPAKPGKARLRTVRAFPLFGLDVRDEVGGPIEGYRRALAAAIVAAGNRSTPGHLAVAGIEDWGRRAQDGLFGLVDRILKEESAFADRLAGRDAIRPDQLPDDPTLPG
jgi:hypothetical protein